MKHPFDGWMGCQPFGEKERMGIQLWCPFLYISAGFLQGNGIGIAETSHRRAGGEQCSGPG